MRHKRDHRVKIPIINLLLMLEEKCLREILSAAEVIELAKNAYQDVQAYLKKATLAWLILQIPRPTLVECEVCYCQPSEGLIQWCQSLQQLSPIGHNWVSAPNGKLQWGRVFLLDWFLSSIVRMRWRYRHTYLSNAANQKIPLRMLQLIVP